MVAPVKLLERFAATLRDRDEGAPRRSFRPKRNSPAHLAPWQVPRGTGQRRTPLPGDTQGRTHRFRYLPTLVIGAFNTMCASLSVSFPALASASI